MANAVTAPSPTSPLRSHQAPRTVGDKRSQSISGNWCLLSGMNKLEFFTLRETRHLNDSVLVMAKVFVKPTTSLACALSEESLGHGARGGRGVQM